MSARTIDRSAGLRSEQFVQQVIDLLQLPDKTAHFQVLDLLSQGNDGEIYKLVVNYQPYVVKLYKSGLNEQYVHFQQELLKNQNSPQAKRQPGYEAVYHIAQPVGWVSHTGRKGLVFRYVPPPRSHREPNARDRVQIKHQMQFLHWLGFCHLDITERNVLLSEGGKCYLMDYDCVCRIGCVPLGPLPPESTDTVMRRDPVDQDDDNHLWLQLQDTLFAHAPLSDDTVTVNTNAKQFPHTSSSAPPRASVLDR